MRTRRWVSVAAAASFALLVACSDVTSATSAGTGSGAAVPDNSDTTITLAINPWVGSEVNVAVAKQLLEDKLGYSVETTNIDEFAQFPAISSGDIDATL